MSTLKRITKRSEMGVLIPLLLLWIITGCFNKNFFSSMSMFSLFRSISVTLLGSIGATFVFSCGMMDLSVGAVYGLSSMVAGMLMVNAGLPPALAMLGGLVVAALFGMLNGFTINTLGLPAFISTLGTQYIGRGVVNVISGGKQIAGLPESFLAMGGKGPFGLYWSIYIAIIFAIIAGMREAAGSLKALLNHGDYDRSSVELDNTLESYQSIYEDVLTCYASHDYQGGGHSLQSPKHSGDPHAGDGDLQYGGHGFGTVRRRKAQRAAPAEAGK